GGRSLGSKGLLFEFEGPLSLARVAVDTDGAPANGNSSMVEVAGAGLPACGVAVFAFGAVFESGGGGFFGGRAARSLKVFLFFAPNSFFGLSWIGVGSGGREASCCSVFSTDGVPRSRHFANRTMPTRQTNEQETMSPALVSRVIFSSSSLGPMRFPSLG